MIITNLCFVCFFLDENQLWFIDLKYLIESTFFINGNIRVTLLAHSMGGPMTLLFLQRQSQEWKDKFIHKYITLSAPWGGSVKAVKVYAVGELFFNLYFVWQ